LGGQARNSRVNGLLSYRGTHLLAECDTLFLRSGPVLCPGCVKVALRFEIGYNQISLISPGRDGIGSFFENTVVHGTQEMESMGEQQKECRECGWRGSAAELDETIDASTGKTHIFCPACGGAAIEDLKPDTKGQAPEA